MCLDGVMIQRYNCNPSGANDPRNYTNEDDDYYLCSDIDPLIEWRDLTEKDRPVDYKWVEVWFKENHSSSHASIVNNVFRIDCGEDYIKRDNIYNGTIKWRHYTLPVNPWRNK